MAWLKTNKYAVNKEKLNTNGEQVVKIKKKKKKKKGSSLIYGSWV